MKERGAWLVSIQILGRSSYLYSCEDPEPSGHHSGDWTKTHERTQTSRITTILQGANSVGQFLRCIEEINGSFETVLIGPLCRRFCMKLFQAGHGLSMYNQDGNVQGQKMKR